MQIRESASATHRLNLTVEAGGVTRALEVLGESARPACNRAGIGHVGSEVESPVGMKREGDGIDLGAGQESCVDVLLDLRDDGVAVSRPSRERRRRPCRYKRACTCRWSG